MISSLGLGNLSPPNQGYLNFLSAEPKFLFRWDTAAFDQWDTHCLTGSILLFRGILTYVGLIEIELLDFFCCLFFFFPDCYHEAHKSSFSAKKPNSEVAVVD